MKEIIIGNERMAVNGNVTIEEAMLSFGRYPDAFLYLLDGRPIPMTTPITDGMSVEALRVASGG